MTKNPFITAIVQARMSSKRLPGKVMAEINGIPMIQILLERLNLCNLLNEIIVATTNKKEDDILSEFLNKLGIKVFRGDESDVLSRYVEATKISKCDTVVRITADCPLIDPVIISKVIKKFLSGNFDYLSNINPPSFPDGMDVEIFSKKALLLANQNSSLRKEREHVTPWIREKDILRKGNFSSLIDLSKIRLTVDYKEDLILIKDILREFGYRLDISLEDILEYKKRSPKIFEINNSFKRNEGANMTDGQKMWERAKKVIPGGNMLLSKRSELYLPGAWPTYFSKTKGCKVWDLEGNRYIDMSLMGVGTNILGYSHQKVDEAVKKIVKLGNMSTLNCPEEVLLAEKLVELHPWSEMVRFARTGGEANSIAVRIARAASGRDKVAICGYHGWHDWYLATNLKYDNQLDEHLLPGLEPNGVPKVLEGTTLSFSYNKIDELKDIIKNNDLAAVKMEVERNFPPKEGFLQEVRELCNKHGIILIFDECTSGFRETFGGLHLKYKVFPDLAIFGKALGNGYAITSVIGKREVMEAAQTTFISSTFWTERIGPNAALKTLEIMEKEKSWEQITYLGKYLRNGWKEISKKNNLDIQIRGIPSLTSYSFNSKYNLEYKTFITQEMLNFGYLASNACYLSIAHNKKLIDSYLDKLDILFEKIKSCEGSENVKEYLKTPVCHAGFKRLN